MEAGKIIYKEAKTAAEFEEGKALFLEYAHSLNFDLCFQDFDTELESIDSVYNAPSGALFIAYKDGVPIGCTAIRKQDTGIAELKRMYIQPGYRGQKIGYSLLKLNIDKAIELGYTKIRLDTLPHMTKAIALYRNMNFYEIGPYCFNPFKEAIYMEKDLSR
jgi:GNAT superfamily N-acetyltransferase